MTTKSIFSIAITTLIVTSVAFCLWLIFLTELQWPANLFPSISELYTLHPNIKENIYKHAFSTYTSAIIGFFIALVSGFIIASSGFLFPLMRLFLKPLILIGQVTPKIVLAPIIFALVTHTFKSDAPFITKIIVSALIGFLPVFTATETGLSSVEEQRLKLFKSMGANKYETYWFLQLRFAMPDILSAAKVSFVFCLMGALTIEFIGYGDSGLGYLIMRMQSQLAYSYMYIAVGYCILAGGVGYFTLSIIETVVVQKKLKLPRSNQLSF